MTQTPSRKYVNAAEGINAVIEDVNGVEYLRVATVALPSSASGGGYENVEFDLATAQTNFNAASIVGLFDTITTARSVNIRTDKTISIRLNSVANAAITIATTDSPFVINDISVTNIFITNTSGSTAAIKILLT